MKYNLLKRIAATMLAVTMLFSVAAPAPVQAGTFTAQTAKKMKTISKTGKHTVVAPANTKENYVQFKAPKAGTYVFDFTGIYYDGEAEDMATSDYYFGKSYDYMGMLNIAPIVKNKLQDQFSLINTNALYDTAATLAGMTKEDFISFVSNEGYTTEDVETLVASEGVELSHTYTVKLKKGQKIQFVVMNYSANYNKHKQNVVVNIKKK